MTDLVWGVIVALLILTLPTLGFILCSVVSAGKIEDAWEEGYQTARADLTNFLPESDYDVRKDFDG